MRIELKQIDLQYPGRKRLFEKLEFFLQDGDFAIIQGPSGSGKSSLLRLINRLQEPDAGEIQIDGHSLKEESVPSLRRRIGYVQQIPIMVEGSVRENLIFPFRYQANADLEKPDDAVLLDWLERLLLHDIQLPDSAGELSVGQRQRLALVRSLLLQPEVLLCDEPTSALDTDSKRIVEEQLENLNLQQGIGVVLVTHSEAKFTSIGPKRFRISGKRLQEAGG